MKEWSSCSRIGNLTFDSDLMRFGSDEWDYVIVHELLHFSIPNHGRLWKSLMRAHLGEFERIEKGWGLSKRGIVNEKRNVLHSIQ